MSQKSACVTGHSAVIFDRGAMRPVTPMIDLTRIRWERTRDGVSEAMIRLDGPLVDGQQCALAESALNALDKVRSHRHELVIYRGNDRVWEGPVHRKTVEETYAEIHAKDILAYLGAQPLTQKWDNSVKGVGAQPVTTRLENIINYELSHGRTMKNLAGADVAIKAWEDPAMPPINVLQYLDVRHFPNEAGTAAVTLPYQTSVLEHMRYFARQSGIDFTVFGRKLLIWDVSRNLGVLTTMTGSNFIGRTIASEYGADHAQAAYVTGMEGAYGQAVNEENLDYYGPWTTMFTAYQEEGTDAPTVAQLTSQARRNLSGRSPVPIEIRIPDNSTILLTDVLTIQHLVPGVQVPLRANVNGIAMNQQQKIDHVTVTETADGENVQVTLTPATKPDSDEPED